MTLADEINRMIQTILESAEFTSASPGVTNTLVKINAEDSPDLEAEIESMLDESGDVNKSPEQIKERRTFVESSKKEEVVSDSFRSLQSGIPIFPHNTFMVRETFGSPSSFSKTKGKFSRR